MAATPTVAGPGRSFSRLMSVSQKSAKKSMISRANTSRSSPSGFEGATAVSASGPSFVWFRRSERYATYDQCWHSLGGIVNIFPLPCGYKLVPNFVTERNLKLPVSNAPGQGYWADRVPPRARLVSGVAGATFAAYGFYEGSCLLLRFANRFLAVGLICRVQNTKLYRLLLSLRPYWLYDF